MGDDIKPERGVDIDAPLPKTLNREQQRLLELVQGNILKGHGRKITTLLFASFGNASETRGALSKLEPLLTSAATQLAQARTIRNSAVAPDRRPFVGCALASTGYRKLGLEAQQPLDLAFRSGMSARSTALSDPPIEQWEEHLRSPVDALLWIAGDPGEEPGRSPEVESMEAEIRALVQPAVQIIARERGRAWVRSDGSAVEHFGFLDGKSQPLFLEEDIERTPAQRWSPAFPPRQVLVRDPVVADPCAYGSYLVFRKLEQNVSAFEHAAAELQTELERVSGRPLPSGFAGATLIGRHRDGTPLVSQELPGAGADNDFDYGDDPLGFKCPFHAHVRKANPRGESRSTDERTHLIARRGVTYGDREFENDGFTDTPEIGVGLLFLAYQSDIGNQFEHIQKQWADNPDFARRSSGVDLVLGSGSVRSVQQRAGWNDAGAPKAQLQLQRFVRLLGGEYFFAPSKAFFRQLG